MNEQNRLPIKKDMYTEYKHIGPGPKDYEKTIVAPGHYRLTESTEYAKGDSSAEYEGCEICNGMKFILSNDKNNKPDLQKCDDCNYFKTDQEAKDYVLKFILKEEQQNV